MVGGFAEFIERLQRRLEQAFRFLFRPGQTHQLHVGRLVGVPVLALGFAEGCRIPLHVQDVIHHLEGQADMAAIFVQGGQLLL